MILLRLQKQPREVERSSKAQAQDLSPVIREQTIRTVRSVSDNWVSFESPG